MRSSPRGRGWAKGEANRGLDGHCTPVMWRVTREWAGMRVWPATRATPLMEVRSRQISQTAGCKTGGTISKLFNKLLNLPNTFIPTSAGTSLFFFLVEGSLESLTTNTGTTSHFCPKSSKSTITTPLYGISNPFTAFKVTWVMGRSEFCSFSTTHLSVTVVTSLPVSGSPLTFLRFIAVSTVGHRPVMPTGFMSPIVWLLTTGTSSFPGGMESVVQRCAAECRIVAGDGWVWRRLEGPCHGASRGTHLHLGCSSYTDPHIQLCSHQIIFDTPEDYDRQDLFTNTQNTSTLKLQHTTLSQHKNQFRHWSVSDICKLESPITGQHQIYAI